LFPSIIVPEHPQAAGRILPSPDRKKGPLKKPLLAMFMGRYKAPCFMSTGFSQYILAERFTPFGMARTKMSREGTKGMTRRLSASRPSDFKT
jgi:hypothetical protein